jgi:hypothetical protein
MAIRGGGASTRAESPPDSAPTTPASRDSAPATPAPASRAVSMPAFRRSNTGPRKPAELITTRVSKSRRA